MLKMALLFFVISLIAGVLGFGGIAGAAAGIAKFIFGIAVFVFLVFVVLAVMGWKAITD